MLYTLEQGPVEERILRQCQREHLPLPERIKNAPQLELGLELYYTAFLDLMTSRGGMGDGAISWQVAQEYGLVNSFDEEQIEDLHYHITRMDDAYMKWNKAKGNK